MKGSAAGFILREAMPSEAAATGDVIAGGRTASTCNTWAQLLTGSRLSGPKDLEPASEAAALASPCVWDNLGFKACSLAGNS